MLTLYRRHLSDCPHESRQYRRCKCPIWVQGSLAREKIRKSLDLTSWESATDRINEWVSAGEIGNARQEIPVLPEAIERFLVDCEARHLQKSTITKFRILLKSQLLPYCEKNGLRYLRDLDVDEVRRFRATWTADSPISALKKFERFRSFLRFCVDSEWVKKNPALAVKPPKVAMSPTLPFTDEEMTSIIGACGKFATVGKYRAKNRNRALAMVLLLRYSGLRIRDAVTLERTRIRDGKLFLYTQKTGTPVHLPLPESVLTALTEVSEETQSGYFWGGSGKVESAVGIWERTFKRVFEIAKIKNGHCHRFRDTFAVSLLQRGVPLEDVSILLGHSSILITEKHYAPWVQARQNRLEQLVQQSW